MAWNYDSTKALLRNNKLTRGPYLWLAGLSHSARFLFYKMKYGRAFPPSYFNDLFAEGADPWRYEGDSVSETRKSLILDLLPESPVSHMLEIGCASGWITQHLSRRAKRVTAVDCSSVALSLAKERCSGCSNVEFAALDLLTDGLEGSFDVVVCAGVLNFFPRSAQAAIRDKIVGSIKPGGQLLLEHLRARAPGYEVTGEELHALYAGHPWLVALDRKAEDAYEIILLRRE